MVRGDDDGLGAATLKYVCVVLLLHYMRSLTPSPAGVEKAKSASEFQNKLRAYTQAFKAYVTACT